MIAQASSSSRGLSSTERSKLERDLERRRVQLEQARSRAGRPPPGTGEPISFTPFIPALTRPRLPGRPASDPGRMDEPGVSPAPDFWEPPSTIFLPEAGGGTYPRWVPGDFRLRPNGGIDIAAAAGPSSDIGAMPSQTALEMLLADFGQGPAGAGAPISFAPFSPPTPQTRRPGPIGDGEPINFAPFLPPPARGSDLTSRSVATTGVDSRGNPIVPPRGPIGPIGMMGSTPDYPVPSNAPPDAWGMAFDQIGNLLGGAMESGQAARDARAAAGVEPSEGPIDWNGMFSDLLGGAMESGEAERARRTAAGVPPSEGPIDWNGIMFDFFGVKPEGPTPATWASPGAMAVPPVPFDPSAPRWFEGQAPVLSSSAGTPSPNPAWGIDAPIPTPSAPYDPKAQKWFDSRGGDFPNLAGLGQRDLTDIDAMGVDLPGQTEGGGMSLDEIASQPLPEDTDWSVANQGMEGIEGDIRAGGNAQGQGLVTERQQQAAARVAASIPPGAHLGTDGYYYAPDGAGGFKTVGRVPGVSPSDLYKLANAGVFSDPEKTAALFEAIEGTRARTPVDKPKGDSVWDSIVTGAGNVLENSFVGGAVKGLFPDLWFGAGEAIKGLDNGASTGNRTFPNGADDAYWWQSMIGPDDDRTRKSSGPKNGGGGGGGGGGNNDDDDDDDDNNPPGPTPTDPGATFPQTAYDRWGNVVFPALPPYNPGVDPEWLYFRRNGFADGGPVYAEGGDVSALNGQDPRVEVIAKAEDALEDIFEGEQPDEEEVAALKEFVAKFGDAALRSLAENVKAGMKMRPRMVRGPGGPTDDAIPAMIDGAEPAALSDGEFVVPADAVMGAGDGDRDLGAERLLQLSEQLSARKAA